LLHFVIRITIITLLIALMTWVGAHYAWWSLPTYWIEILVFILLMTGVIYYNLNKLRGNRPEAFTQFYLLSIVLKMVGGLTLISIIVWTEPSAAIGNVTLFVVSYLMLTGLEVFSLLRKSAG
jgi:hypothetical protein